MFNHAEPHSASGSLVKNILASLNTLRPYSEAAIRRRAARQLAYLPDYLKRDIGLIDD